MGMDKPVSAKQLISRFFEYHKKNNPAYSQRKIAIYTELYLFVGNVYVNAPEFYEADGKYESRIQTTGDFLREHYAENIMHNRPVILHNAYKCYNLPPFDRLDEEDIPVLPIYPEDIIWAYDFHTDLGNVLERVQTQKRIEIGELYSGRVVIYKTTRHSYRISGEIKSNALFQPGYGFMTITNAIIERLKRGEKGGSVYLNHLGSETKTLKHIIYNTFQKCPFEFDKSQKL